MTVAAQDRARPASGIAIVPEQLTRMRDLRALSREDLAERAGRILFDHDRFAGVLAGRVPPDARTARALWLALDCDPGDLVRGLPPGLPRAGVSRWLRQNSGWSADLDAVSWHSQKRGWSQERLAEAVSRYWFSRDSVNKIERGERRPAARTLRAFCKVLRCAPADLMTEDGRLPDGSTKARRDLLDYNAGMRAFADARGIGYRNPETGRIRYTRDLREAYEKHLAGLAS